jgi:hypothetical protein
MLRLGPYSLVYNEPLLVVPLFILLGKGERVLGVGKSDRAEPLSLVTSTRNCTANCCEDALVKFIAICLDTAVSKERRGLRKHILKGKG